MREVRYDGPQNAEEAKLRLLELFINLSAGKVQIGSSDLVARFLMNEAPEHIGASIAEGLLSPGRLEGGDLLRVVAREFCVAQNF